MNPDTIPVRATILSAVSMFVYVVILNIILHSGHGQIPRAIAVTLIEGISNMLRCPLAVVLIFKTHEKNEQQRKLLSREYRQELERQDALRKRLEINKTKEELYGWNELVLKSLELFWFIWLMDSYQFMLIETRENKVEFLWPTWKLFFVIEPHSQISTDVDGVW